MGFSVMAAVGGSSVWVINICAILLLNLFSTASGDALRIKFGYTGPIGPSNWGRLNPTFSACSTGKSQSPINIDSANLVINKNLKPLIMQYNHSEVATLVDNGFNVGVKYGENAGTLVVDGKTYNLKQMHWHSPSEHRLDGTQYAAELHLVHFAEDNSIAVLATLFHIGHPDPLMTKLQNKLNELARDVASQKETQIQLGTIDTHEIRKHTHKYYSYTGSLTTPPCSENVSWHILGKVRSISREQVEALRAPLDSRCKRNARPVQPLNGRQIQMYEVQANVN
ncbi:PREDICTED: alpha carbonic anhydrase 1, chloroplastic [Nicotiana attenuata]|uniref:Carbonic anhydrase n=1 Tax=Nicotiana attenuata TaxID=49451 RepID=A0A314L422_NICAT|nr:PREDICTED: alpha carbonic anhydrase 1, chloroplastic [Nicotiana attenuata]OIT35694.1 alpha carbonic anhydrase 1, chloroplastic [Nicotiana attenuata]